MIIYFGIGLIFALFIFRMAELSREKEKLAEIFTNKLLVIGIFIMYVVSWPYWLISFIKPVNKRDSIEES